MSGHYDVAQICINGHVINSGVRSSPEFNADFCELCGGHTIMDCGNCQAPIRGMYHMEGVFDFGTYDAPSYCIKCGSPYPWTQSALDAAFELVEFSEALDAADKADLRQSISNIVQETPKTSLAVMKFKKYAVKAGKEIAGGLKDVLVEVVSESVKKAIWG